MIAKRSSWWSDFGATRWVGQKLTYPDIIINCCGHLMEVERPYHFNDTIIMYKSMILMIDNYGYYIDSVSFVAIPNKPDLAYWFTEVTFALVNLVSWQ